MITNISEAQKLIDIFEPHFIFHSHQDFIVFTVIKSNLHGCQGIKASPWYAFTIAACSLNDIAVKGHRKRKDESITLETL